MRKLLSAVLIASLATPILAEQVRVRSTVRKDGIYIPSHVRTSPNRTKLDNYSTKPNVNPRSGKAGTVNPYKIPKLGN